MAPHLGRILELLRRKTGAARTDSASLFTIASRRNRNRCPSWAPRQVVSRTVRDRECPIRFLESCRRHPADSWEIIWFDDRARTELNGESRLIAFGFPLTDICRDSLGVALDTAAGKTISYLHEDYRLLQGPDRSAGRISTDGPYRTGAGVRRRACRSRGLPPRPACGSEERGRHRLAARLSAEGLLRAQRL